MGRLLSKLFAGKWHTPSAHGRLRSNKARRRVPLVLSSSKIALSRQFCSILSSGRTPLALRDSNGRATSQTVTTAGRAKPFRLQRVPERDSENA
jgi:hypothetical protein